ncbi:MAG TPA: DUF4384 domain-containing protein [Bryobacteraceae bacterium]|jgi:hypothetical protein|nr:DUF4384 domain-containing protein [Bryobacteraceae bacterium]
MPGFLSRVSIAFLVLLAVRAGSDAQTKTLSVAGNRMEIQVDRFAGDKWTPVDPALVFERGDRVRFRFRTNFDGYLYVTNISTSGSYALLFPRPDTGEQNRIHAGTEYILPETQTRFRIAGPAGHETLYWIVSPTEWRSSDGGSHSGYIPLPPPPQEQNAPPPNMTPRCDDTVFRARGDCVDPAAGARELETVPPNLAGIPSTGQDQNLMFLREENKSVIASPAPLHGPVVYEFLLAHK